MVILGRYSEYVYAIFRIVFGFLIMLHGTQKIFGVPEAKMQAMGLPYYAGFIELICGLLILVGFFSSIAAFIACGMFAVAYFMVHQPGGPLPIMNGGELAVAYCFVCLYIAARGSGILSIDGMMRGSRSSTTS